MTKRVTAALAASLPATGQALAHSGDHSHLTISEIGAHLAHWPDHLAIILIAAFAVLVAFGAKRMRRARQRK